MRKIFSVLAAAALAAGISLFAAAPAQAAGPYCFGLPDEPLAFVCVTVNEPTVPNPAVTWGQPFYVTDVPAVCYGLGCTEAGPFYMSIPWVSGLGGVPTLVEVYWAGRDRINVDDLVSWLDHIAENPFRLCAVPPLPEYVRCFST